MRFRPLTPVSLPGVAQSASPWTAVGDYRVNALGVHVHDFPSDGGDRVYGHSGGGSDSTFDSTI